MNDSYEWLKGKCTCIWTERMEGTFMAWKTCRFPLKASAENLPDIFIHSLKTMRIFHVIRLFVLDRWKSPLFPWLSHFPQRKSKILWCLRPPTNNPRVPPTYSPSKCESFETSYSTLVNSLLFSLNLHYRTQHDRRTVFKDPSSSSSCSCTNSVSSSRTCLKLLSSRFQLSTFRPLRLHLQVNESRTNATAVCTTGDNTSLPRLSKRIVEITAIVGCTLVAYAKWTPVRRCYAPLVSALLRCDNSEVTTRSLEGTVRRVLLCHAGKMPCQCVLAN